MSTSDDYPQNVPPEPTPGYGSGYPGSPPQSAGAPDPSAQAGQGVAPEAFAGFWIRFLGALIDGLLLGLASGLIQTVVGGGGVIGFVIAGAYFTYFHSTPAGQTVGNRVCGIRIVDSATGGHLDYVRALLRWLMSYVSGIALLIGYFWMLWDPENQTWHDKVANSYVVKASVYPPPAEFGKPASST